jgi:hypothetical protein
MFAQKDSSYRAVAIEDGGTAPPVTHGLSALAALVFAGHDAAGLMRDLLALSSGETPDLGAAMDLATLLQLTGRGQDGLTLQAEVLERCRHFRVVHGTGEGPRLLALMAPGDFMANTPVDFLLKGSNVTFDMLFLDPAEGPPATVPPHDLAIMAVGESDDNTALLRALSPALAVWPRPILNGDAAAILGLRRDLAAVALDGLPGLLAATTVRASRADLIDIARGAMAVANILSGADFPLIVRPLGSHAGAGLERIEGAAALAAYLEARPEPMFYLAPFIDYASADGRFRKYRLAFVAGAPFLAHLAISDHWMIHYLNAGMTEDAAKRAEEAEAMRDFDTAFAARHAAAFAAMSARLGLDYYGVDCAQTPDGRLLVFEADTAMIVHDMDPPDVFPYKAANARRLFAAFQRMLIDATAS